MYVFEESGYRHVCVHVYACIIAIHVYVVTFCGASVEHLSSVSISNLHIYIYIQICIHIYIYICMDQSVRLTGWPGQSHQMVHVLAHSSLLLVVALLVKAGRCTASGAAATKHSYISNTTPRRSTTIYELLLQY